MKYTIKIDGVDFTDFFTPTGYTVSYKKIRGKNSGYMMDGSYTDDVVNTKTTITCVCMPMNLNQLQVFLTAISKTYVDVYYYDPQLARYATSSFMPSEPSQKFKGTGADMLDYWTGTVMTFTEK